MFVLAGMTTRNLKIVFALVLITIVFIVIWAVTNSDISRYQLSPFGTYFNRCKTNECKYGPQSFMWTKKVQLCIMFNLNNISPKKEVIDLLLSYYSIFFNHVMLLFDGDWYEKPSYIPENVAFSGCRSHNGWFQQHCLSICLNETWENGDKPEGYLYIADDMFINLTKMSMLPLSKVWYLNMRTINYTARASLKKWHWKEVMKPLETVVNNLPAKWKQVLVKYVGFPNHMHASGTADLVYVPHSLAENMTDVLNYVIKTASLMSEVAFPLAIDIIAPTDQAHFIQGYLWAAERTLENIKKTAKTAHFVHPLKLSSKNHIDLWKSFMEEVKAAAL